VVRSRMNTGWASEDWAAWDAGGQAIAPGLVRCGAAGGIFGLVGDGLFMPQSVCRLTAGEEYFQRSLTVNYVMNPTTMSCCQRGETMTSSHLSDRERQALQFADRSITEEVRVLRSTRPLPALI
jgi:hypothetical protein